MELDCPWCGRPHLGFNTRSRVFSCWYCGKKKTDETLGRLLGVHTDSELQTILRKYSTDVPVSAGPRVIETPVGGKYIEPANIPLTRAHGDYLRRRGFNPKELVEKWGISSVPGWEPLLGNRVLMPLTFDGVKVSWQARTVFPDVEPRYLTASKDQEQVHHKDLVYGWDYASLLGRAVLVEGPMDAWKLGPGAVHGFGVQLMAAQVRLLSQLDEVFVVFDSEPKAQTIGRDIARQLAALGTRAEYVDLETSKDPGELSMEEGQTVMNELMGEHR